MRDKLKPLEGVRRAFYGTFERYGQKTGWVGYPLQTILLLNIKDCMGKVVADHLWINQTKGIEPLGELKQGDKIRFEARVVPYVKGYMGRKYDDEYSEHPIEQDYKLSHPTKFMKFTGDLN